jgi:ELWxxDGT repeat protein
MKQEKIFLEVYALRALRLIAPVSSFLIVFVLFAHHVNAQAVLIKDVNQMPDIVYPEYSDFVLGSSTRLFFVSQGKELWATDGTTAGTIRYKTLNAISDLTMVGSTLYFVGDSDNSGRELWKCTGPPPNISLVKQIAPGAAGSDPRELTDVNGTLYFVANGSQLWKSNGTDAGTMMIKTFLSSNDTPAGLTNVNGILYFVADDIENGLELWRSDGTAAGTRVVKDINPGGASSEPSLLTSMNGILYFTAYHPSTGRELWRSNGTVAGTVLVKEFIAGPDGPVQITEPGVMGNAMYFFVDNGFWKSTGTSYGTTLVKNGLTPERDAIDAASHIPTPINGLLYFAASGSVWVSNGTAAGTHAVTPVTLYSNPQFTAFNGSIYYFDYWFEDEEYTAYARLMKMNPNGTNVGEVWRTPSYMHDVEIPGYIPDLATVNNFLLFDGIAQKGQGQKLLKLNATADGVVVVKDAFPSTASGNPSSFLNVNGLVYFKSTDAVGTDRYVNRTDGTSAGTFQIKTLGIVWEIFTAGTNVFFTGMDGDDFQLWKTNGTVAGTLLIKEGDYANYATASYTDLNGLLLFSNAQGELWRSDGTVAGTGLLKTFSGIRHVIAAGTVAYILADNGGQTELWKTNGQTSGTTLVKSFSAVSQIISAGTGAYLLVGNNGETELWRTNGTPTGTVKIETLLPSTGFDTQYYFVGNNTVNGVTFFFGTDPYKGHEFWRTTGTATGTYRIKEILVNNPTNEILQPVNSVAIFNNNLYISTVDEQLEYALYKSNGTSYGTVKLKNMKPIMQVISLQDKLLLFPHRASPQVHPDLWISDGTVAGTKPVATINSESDFYFPIRYEVVDGVAYFTNADRSLWRTDGSACGTFQVQTGLSLMTAMESIGNNLIFGGFAGYQYGNELYRFDLSNVPASPCVTAMSSEVAEGRGNSEILFSAPNPFNNDFTLRVNAPDDIQTEVRVYTVNGKLIESLNSQPNVGYQLGEEWAPGLYLVMIRVGDETMTRKMIKK